MINPSKSAVAKLHEWFRERVCDYTELFVNRWNKDCGCCWAGLIAVSHLIAGVIIGKLL